MTTGQAALGVWNDIDAGLENEFNDWYQGEHLPERLCVPGFLDVRRGVALSDSPKYCALYTLESLAVLSAPVYRARLAGPTPRTRAIMPYFRNMNRSACAITLDHGRGIGGMITTLALSPAEGKARALRSALGDSAFAELGRRPGVLRVQLWEADRALSQVKTEEQSLRPQLDAASDWVIVIDHMREDDGLCERLAAATAAAGAAVVGAPRSYRMLCFFSRN